MGIKGKIGKQLEFIGKHFKPTPGGRGRSGKAAITPEKIERINALRRQGLGTAAVNRLFGIKSENYWRYGIISKDQMPKGRVTNVMTRRLKKDPLRKARLEFLPGMKMYILEQLALRTKAAGVAKKSRKRPYKFDADGQGYFVGRHFQPPRGNPRLLGEKLKTTEEKLAKAQRLVDEGWEKRRVANLLQIGQNDYRKIRPRPKPPRLPKKKGGRLPIQKRLFPDVEHPRPDYQEEYLATIEDPMEVFRLRGGSVKVVDPGKAVGAEKQKIKISSGKNIRPDPKESNIAEEGEKVAATSPSQDVVEVDPSKVGRIKLRKKKKDKA